MGIIITLITLIIITLILISNSFSILLILLIFILLLSILFPQFSASTTIEFYNSYFKIKYPLLSFLPYYKDQRFKYNDINIVIYRYKLREPNRIEIEMKNGLKRWFWCRLRYFSNDKNKIGDLLSNKNIEFHYRRFGKIMKFNQTGWTRLL